jgi:hypothetical protein
MKLTATPPQPSTNSLLARQIKTLWGYGFNTAEIAERTGANECDVHNLHCRLQNAKHEVAA